MQEKKLLRDALKKIAWRALEPSMRTIAKDALASTTEETEMEKLKKRLDIDITFHSQRAGAFYKQRKYADRHFERGHVVALRMVKDYITTQFGEEEGDADREGD